MKARIITCLVLALVASDGAASLEAGLSQRSGHDATSNRTSSGVEPAVLTARPLPAADPRLFPLGFRLRRG